MERILTTCFTAILLAASGCDGARRPEPLVVKVGAVFPMTGDLSDKGRRQSQW